MIAYDAQLN